MFFWSPIKVMIVKRASRNGWKQEMLRKNAKVCHSLRGAQSRCSHAPQTLAFDGINQAPVNFTFKLSNQNET